MFAWILKTNADMPGSVADTTRLSADYSGAPNPTKVALFLEETGTPYDPIPIDTRIDGEKFWLVLLAFAWNFSIGRLLKLNKTAIGDLVQANCRS